MFELSIRTPSAEGIKTGIPLWLHPEYLAAVGELQDIETKQLVCYKGDQIVAMLPLYEKKKMGVRRLISPVSAYYQGLWFFGEAQRGDNRAMLDELHISSEVAQFILDRYKRIHFNLTPANYDVRGFTWAGLKVKPLYTFTHKLTEPFNILKDERKKLKIAQDQGYYLDDEFNAEQFIRMLKDLHQRKGQRFALSYPNFAVWITKLHKLGLLSQYSLKRDNEIVSTNLVLGTQQDTTAYAIMRCTKQEDLKNGASALHSTLLVEKLASQFQYIDFCGANVPEVARFKAALGFELKIFFQIHN